MQNRVRPAVVLLVDDDPGDQELTRRALQDNAVRVKLQIANDGVEAMEYMLAEGVFSTQSAPRPDLVLLDLNMPKLDGRQVLQRIRGHPTLKNIPVVVLTTSSQEEDIIRSYNLGCSSFITKPVDLPQFLRVVKELRRYWFELVTLPSEVCV